MYPGVNPTDWKSRRSGGNVSVAEEIVPNQDGAGEVATVGDGVDPARVPANRFTLQQIAAAHDAVERGIIGKVLVELP